MEGAGLAVLLLVGDVSGRRDSNRIDKMHDRVCCQKKTQRTARCCDSCGHIQFNVTEKRTDTGDYRGDVRANLRAHQIFVRDWMLGYWTGRAPVMHSLAPTTALVCGQMKNGGAGKLPDVRAAWNRTGAARRGAVCRTRSRQE